MALDEQFCLRWNNYKTCLVGVLESLLKKEAFVDVTIACEGRVIKAHRIILSACSPYFEKIFIDLEKTAHPIVILQDVHYKDMKTLLHFMYTGEVTIARTRLLTFLKMAQSLEVKGLSECFEDAGKEPNNETTSPNGCEENQKSSPGKDDEKTSNVKEEDSSLLECPVEVKMECASSPPPPPLPQPCVELKENEEKDCNEISEAADEDNKSVDNDVKLDDPVELGLPKSLIQEEDVESLEAMMRLNNVPLLMGAMGDANSENSALTDLLAYKEYCRLWTSPTKGRGRKASERGSSVSARGRAGYNPNGYKCPYCGKVFNYVTSRYRHIYRNHLVERYSCPACGKVNSRRAYLSMHLRSHPECYEKCVRDGTLPEITRTSEAGRGRGATLPEETHDSACPS